MKKYLNKFLYSLPGFCLSISLSAFSAYEGFNYEDGNLANGTGGTGWMEDTGWGGFPRGNGINNGVAGSSAMVVEAQTLEAPTD